MIQRLSINSLFGLELVEEEPSRVAIPLEVIRQQMNVPMVAIRAIAKSEGIEIDNQSECISENSLGVYADAYIRKLKEYFRRMTHNNGLMLDPEDIIVFDQFCETFKKSTLGDSKVRSWDDIDQEAIREHFTQTVLTKAPKKKNQGDESPFALRWPFQLQIVDIPISDSLDNYLRGYCSQRLIYKENSADFHQKSKVLKSVIHSTHYYQKEVTLPALLVHRRLDSVRLIPVVAHYHEYPNSDEDDMQSAA